MVKLPSPEEQAARPVGERGSDRPRMQPQNHHLWGARYGRRREEMRQRFEPRGLLELEQRARQAVVLMEKYTHSDGHFLVAMDLLRLQHNLNFLMICENCHGTHNYDELSAPER